MEYKKLNKAERIGFKAAGAWKWVRAKQNQFAHFLASKGLPFPVGNTLMIAINTAVIAAALYAAFWIALLFIAAYILLIVLQNADLSEIKTDEDDWGPDGTKWMYGPEGYGRYAQYGGRIE